MLEAALRKLGSEDDVQRDQLLGSFAMLIPAQLATEYLCVTLESWDKLSPQRLGELAPRDYLFDAPLIYFFAVIATALVVLAPLQLWDRTKRYARMGALLCVLAVLGAVFPRAGNHIYLQAIVVSLWIALDRDDHGRELLLRSLRWLLLVVLFYSGFQKLAHGFYVQGQLFAFMADQPGFGDLVSAFASSEEAQRLSQMPRIDGAGPFEVASPLLLAASNLTYIGEMSLAPLLAVTKTRRFAVVGTMVLIVAIEAFARELFFGMWFVALLMLFARPKTSRLATYGVLAADLWLIGVRLGWFPEMMFR